MTQAIIAGLIGLLAGFGVGNWVNDDEFERGYQYQNEMQEEMEEMMDERWDEDITPLADDYLSMRPAMMSLETQALSDDEQSGLIYMREEEKLARDVYTTLYEKWSMPIFNNIAQSEQTHTEAVRQLLDKYDLADPVTDDTVGVFTNSNLADLYNKLVAQGEQSREEALWVGATIEDLDIADLDVQMALTDNADITMVYQNLQRGSRNHLRSFVSQLENYGGTYTPEHISQTEYDSIVDSSRETGSGNERGWGGGRNGNGNGMMDGSGGMMNGGGMGGGRN